jgi:predicted ATPase
MTFKYDTNWVVITGAPSSGKTSVIDELAKRGYPIQTEVARELIEEALRHGMTLAEVRSADHVKELQEKILRFKLGRERALDKNTLVFTDRGTPDSIVYFRLAGLDVGVAIETSKIYRYRAVFMLDRLPLVKDGVRTENDTQAEKIGAQILADYRALDYEPVAVPVMPIAERVDFILAKLGEDAAKPL